MQEEFSEIMNKLSENARFALQKSDYYSKRYNNGYMGTEHLLLGIMSMDNSTGAKMLREEGVTTDEIEKALNKVAVEVPGSDMAMMSLSEAVILTLRMAQSYTKEQGLSVIGTEHILYALLSQPNSRASLILDGLKVDSEKIMDEIEALAEEGKTEEAAAKQKAALKKIESKAKSVLAKAKTKKTTAEFAALIKEYGEDPGMLTDESRQKGYLVSADSTTWIKEFVDGAMTLKTEGEISALIPSGYGYFILRLKDRVDSGYVPLVEVKHQIKKLLLDKLQGEKWDTHLDNIVAKAEIIRYEDRLTILNYAE
jgi:parvulin-like peptidyl-prolyl isomerase